MTQICLEPEQPWNSPFYAIEAAIMLWELVNWMNRCVSGTHVNMSVMRRKCLTIIIQLWGCRVSRPITQKLTQKMWTMKPVGRHFLNITSLGQNVRWILLAVYMMPLVKTGMLPNFRQPICNKNLETFGFIMYVCTGNGTVSEERGAHYMNI